MEAAHDKLRTQQLQLRMGARQEELSFRPGQLVWLRIKRFSKGQSHKLQPKYTGSYVVQEAVWIHMYVIEQNGRRSGGNGKQVESIPASRKSTNAGSTKPAIGKKEPEENRLAP